MLHELGSSSKRKSLLHFDHFDLQFVVCVLQCLSNTTPLTEYFVGTQAGYKPYKKHINRDNPLGMGGAIAEAYGALLDDIWSGRAGCVAPRHFKVH